MADGEATQPGAWTADRVAGVALAILAVVVAWETRGLPLGTLKNPGPAYYPLVLAALLGVLGLIVAWRGADSVALRQLRWPELRHAILILGAGAFAAIAFERLGYRLTILVLSVFLMGVVERRNPVVVALVSVALSFGTFYLFNDLLRVPLPQGVLGF